MTVLVIDDDEEIRDGLAEVLTGERLAIATAADGGEALAYLRAHAAPDVILLDLRMPGMDGEAFRQAQLADDVLGHIPIVVMSADRDAKARARQLGAAGFVAKPPNLQTLIDALASACAPVSREAPHADRAAMPEDASTNVRRRTID